MKFALLIFLAITYKFVFTQTIEYCIGDTISHEIPIYTGALQWQHSNDSITWYDISSATYQPYITVFSENKFYRARIISGTCNPVYSQAVHLIEIHNNILGLWYCNETSSIYGTTNYNIAIINDTTECSNIVIQNFHNLGINKNVTALVSGQSINISSAFIDGLTITGTGSISSNNQTITLFYTVDDGTQIDNISATYTKQ